jgi:hypothetical protein
MTTQRDGGDFDLACIPDSIITPNKVDFDTGLMRQLYAVGYDMAAEGYPWQKTPPGFAFTTNTAQRPRSERNGFSAINPDGSHTITWVNCSLSAHPQAPGLLAASSLAISPGSRGTPATLNRRYKA